ncbi:DEAD/DEAH box helicase [Bacteroidota bacterium]
MSKETSSFESLGLNKFLLNAIEEKGFITPTAIQQKIIPLTRAGHDVLGIAPTGTGKTAAYLIPLIMKLKYAQNDHPRALILGPTRELILQINKEIGELTTYIDIRHAAIYGGVGPQKQIKEIQEGLDILVATPGRFIDIYKQGELFTRQIGTLILDEADKMMDMGFMPQIRSILEVIPTKKRQNLLFSATMPEKVEKLSEEFLEFPEKVEIAPQATTAKTVTQTLYKTPNLKTKISLLTYLLQDREKYNRVIIFTKTKETANNVYKYLERKVDDSIRVIHANKGQNTRINALNDFKGGGYRLLVTTDVTARGIDIIEVSHVINFDVPVVYEDYVHRIGRTGRATHLGAAVTFVNPPDEYHIKAIEKVIQQNIPEETLPDHIEIPETEFWEKQQMDREIDHIRRKLDPDFKGAFHDKKRKPLHHHPKRGKRRKK